MKYTILLSFFALALISCGNKTIFSTEQKCENDIWLYSKPLQAEFKIEDTTKLYDIEFSLTHTDNYPFQNIYLSVNDDFAGKMLTDTVNINLSDEYGKWTGTGASDKKIHTFLRKSYKFPKAGSYNIGIQQFTRKDSLSQIKDIGFSVKEVDKK